MFRNSASHCVSGEVTIQVIHNSPHFIVLPDSQLIQHKVGFSLWHRFVVSIAVISLLQFAVPASHAYSRDELLSEMNAARQSNSVQSLQIHSELTVAAEAKAQNMLEEQYFAHISPSGRTPWSWYKEAGYAYTEAGENLALDFLQASDVVNAWLNSPGHRANLLDSKFHDVGIAVMDGPLNGISAQLVVVEFGRQSAASQPPPAPKPVVAKAETPPPTPKPVAPAPLPVTTPVPTAPIVVDSQPSTIDVGIPSLLGTNRPVPNLSFTLVEPTAFVGIANTPRPPRVQGAFTMTVAPLSVPELPMLSLTGLGVSLLLVVGWALAQKSWLAPSLSTA